MIPLVLTIFLHKVRFFRSVLISFRFFKKCAQLRYSRWTNWNNAVTCHDLTERDESLRNSRTHGANMQHIRVEMWALTSLLCRPHPVKPLTSSQSEKKEGRSVLEKLKSTIHPGRTAHQVVAEAERSQVPMKKQTKQKTQHWTLYSLQWS